MGAVTFARGAADGMMPRSRRIPTCDRHPSGHGGPSNRCRKAGGGKTFISCLWCRRRHPALAATNGKFRVVRRRIGVVP
jgi:hypothetical protein